jgi:DNA end-binding protein Ku
VRPVWSGTIAFGLVTVPVKLYPVVESSREVSFHLLDRKTLTPIKEVRVNPKTGGEVPWDQVVRGVEVAKRRYVPLSREEPAGLPLPSAKTTRSLTANAASALPTAVAPPFRRSTRSSSSTCRCAE